MKVLIYCTKAKPYLYHSRYNLNYYLKNYKMEAIEPELRPELLNGKVVASFDFDRWEELIYEKVYDFFELVDGIPLFDVNEICESACISELKLSKYLDNGYKNGYAWHIDNLQVFDEPIELGELYYTDDFICVNDIWKDKPIYRAPQSYMYVRYKGEKCLLLSIKSEYVYDIIEERKTVEIRKSKPKEVER